MWKSRKVSSLLEGPCPKSHVDVALNKIERAMAKLGYALHKGDVFKKKKKTKLQCIPSNTLAPSKSSCQSWLTRIRELKEIIIANFNKLESILADPECEFTQQLNTERCYKRQGHAPLKHFVGPLCNGGKPE